LCYDVEIAETRGMENIHGANSFVLENEKIKLAVIEVGGHLAPVVFRLKERNVSPFALAPWLPDGCDQNLPVLLKSLRGDFLCLPFGGQKNGPPHGETANAEWKLVNQSENEITISIDATDTKAHVEKILSIKNDQQVVYIDHLISKLEGEWNYGNHPILDLSHLPEGSGRIATSSFRWGSVHHENFSKAENGETGALKASSRFSDLRKVEMKDGSFTDLTKYPARKGNDDLVMLVNEAATASQPFAWTAITLDGYVWFSLKNVEDFPSTLFWFSNGGRSGHPWENRHLGRLGAEEVCSYFCDGYDLAREKRLAADQIQTVRKFAADEVVRLPLIQGVISVGEKFGQTQSITPHSEGMIKVTGEDGLSYTTAVDWNFIERKNN
jgi:hypothetical protein